MAEFFDKFPSHGDVQSKIISMMPFRVQKIVTRSLGGLLTDNRPSEEYEVA